jgi:hypothetical protein
MHRLLPAAALILASASAALAQTPVGRASNSLVPPAEVVLYIHADLKSTDFVQPLVCALQRVLVAPVSTQTLDLRFGPELRATPTQFDVRRVGNLFIRTTAGDGTAQSFKYLLIPYDLKDEPWRYVFSLNPAVGVIDGFRWALLGGAAPGPELAVSIGSLALLLLGGILYFRRTERIFADRI